MKLTWQTNEMVSCLHAAEAWLRSPANMDAALAGALTAPATALLQTLLEQGVTPDDFWSHVIPLSAGIQGSHELTQVTLTKVIGRADALPRVARLCGLLNDLKTAFTGINPHSQHETASAAKDLRQRWSYQGEGLLSAVLRWTEPGLLVEDAAVLMVHPVLGGGGTAHLPYNSVRLEAVGADPVAELPEVLRLAWLLSCLNLDLPRYCENLRPRRLTQVAGLAMIPVVLSAAVELGLDGAVEARLPEATAVWMGAAEKATAWAGILHDWWGSYRTLRPAWATALEALDQLLP